MLSPHRSRSLAEASMEVLESENNAKEALGFSSDKSSSDNNPDNNPDHEDEEAGEERDGEGGDGGPFPPFGSGGKQETPPSSVPAVVDPMAALKNKVQSKVCCKSTQA